MSYTIYLLQHTCGRTYIGITTDINRRIRQHNGLLSGGAKSTTRFGPGWELKAAISSFEKGIALKLERQFKKKRGLEKRMEVFQDYLSKNSEIFSLL